MSCGRRSASSASIRSPVSDSCSSPTSARNRPASRPAIASVTCSTYSGRIAPSSSRSGGRRDRPRRRGRRSCLFRRACRVSPMRRAWMILAACTLRLPRRQMNGSQRRGPRTVVTIASQSASGMVDCRSGPGASLRRGAGHRGGSLEYSYHSLILLVGFAVAGLALVGAIAVGPYGRRGVRIDARDAVVRGLPRQRVLADDLSGAARPAPRDRDAPRRAARPGARRRLDARLPGADRRRSSRPPARRRCSPRPRPSRRRTSTPRTGSTCWRRRRAIPGRAARSSTMRSRRCSARCSRIRSA